MNILFIANSVPVYGANRSMLDLAIGLKALGHESFFFIPKKGTIQEMNELNMELQRNSFAYVYIDYNWGVHLNGVSGESERLKHIDVNSNCISIMEHYVKQWDIDMVHTNSLTHTIGAELAYKVHLPHVWHVREALKADYDLLFDDVDNHRKWLRKADRVICISKYVQSVHNEVLTDTKTEVIYDGFEIKNYFDRDEYHANTLFFNLLICGVIRESKGQLDAIKAIHMLVEKYDCRNLHLKIIGGGWGAYYDEICDYIKENRLQSYIQLIPYQKDLRRFRKDAEIALMCSRNEALGRVTIESMLAGNLVIGANTAGTVELIENGVNGYLYEAGNIEDLCKKILFVMQNWEIQGDVIAKAQNFACKMFDNKQYAEAIGEVYEQIKRGNA